MQQPLTKRFYEFGDFRLDVSEKILSHNSETISLTPKVFDTLQILVENAGRLLEKEFLMREIWRDNFVEENNLTSNIKTLRKALGDSASNPRFIETVPRRGYRFVAKVGETFFEDNSPQPLVTENNPTSNNPALQSGRRYFLSPVFIISFTLLFSAVITVFWFARNKIISIASARDATAPILSAPFRSEKLTNTGNAHLAAISPDGKLVAYVDKTNDKFGVWLQRLGTAEKVSIISPSDDFYLGIVFSHDGQSIYFVRRPQNDEQAQGAIFRISTFGGVTTKILDLAEGWISLSPDDRKISFVRCANKNDDFCSLLIADADGQNEQKLITEPNPVRIGDNQFSPDGQSIAFAVGESWSGSNEFSLKKLDISSGLETEISASKFFDIKNLKWLPDGNSLLLTAIKDLSGKIKIWKISSATGEAQMLTNEAATYESLSLNENADKVIASQLSNDFRLYLFSLGNEMKAITNANSFSFATDEKIVYSTFDGDIWMVSRDGSKQQQLTNRASADFAPLASPDGRFIFFTSNRTGSNQIWRMNAADGSNQKQLTTTEGGYARLVSPDGRWVYYESSLHQTLWKVPTEGGSENQIYDKRVFASAFSPDGSQFAYFFRDKTIKIGVVSIETNKLMKTFDLADAKSSPVEIAWANNNLSLDYITRNGMENKLWSQSIDENPPRFLANLDEGDINGFALSPNDNSIALVRGQWLHDAVLIEGLK